MTNKPPFDFSDLVKLAAPIVNAELGRFTGIAQITSACSRTHAAHACGSHGDLLSQITGTVQEMATKVIQSAHIPIPTGRPR